MLRKRVPAYRWWTSPGFGKVELAPVTLAAVTLLLLWVGTTIWNHPGGRSEGSEVALQLMAALIGGPLLVARLLPAPAAAAAAQHRISLSNFIRAPLRNRRRSRSIASWLITLAFAAALLPNVYRGSRTWADDVAVAAGVTGIALITLAWVGFVLPRRYVVRLPRSTPVIQPSVIVARHARAEAIAGAISLTCVVASLILQFLRIYKIGPW